MLLCQCQVQVKLTARANIQKKLSYFKLHTFQLSSFNRNLVERHHILLFHCTMAQNINPHYASSSNPAKQNEDTIKLKDNHAVSKRLQKELMELMRCADKGISAFPECDNLFKWIGTINGPLETVYAGHKYKLSLEFPNSYPYAPPVVKFVTPCFHPNVDTCGSICLDILKDKWTALYDVRTILLSIQSLLAEPNTASPLNQQASCLWANEEAYKKYLDEFYNKHRDT